MTDTSQEEYCVGYKFSIEVETEADIEKVRKFLKEKTGRDAHLEVRIGPLIQNGNGFTCDFKVVDDPFLNGKYSQFPRSLGAVVYVGHLL